MREVDRVRIAVAESQGWTGHGGLAMSIYMEPLQVEKEVAKKGIMFQNAELQDRSEAEYPARSGSATIAP